MTSNFEQLEQELQGAISAASDLVSLEDVRVTALGKKGRISELMKGLGNLPPEERKSFGQAVNGLKERVGAALNERKDALHKAEMSARLGREQADITLMPRSGPLAEGRIHPVSQVMDEITEIFADMGFAIAEGPDIETDYHNFTALNIPEEHPARQEHDTFYFNEKEDGSRSVLRTHTSPVQIRTMLNSQPPLRIIAPGRVYRCDSDQTHTPMFHQVEGLVIDEETHMGHLKWVLESFCKAFFEVDEVKMRFRASHFPFTEPSMEVDIGYAKVGDEIRIGEGDQWLEILGCGMVHPNVLRHVGYDPAKVQGFAFGVGIDRIAMLKYGMPDLRAFFAADLRWLKHYGFSVLDVPHARTGDVVVKFTLSWLKEHLETSEPLDVILDKLTLIGLEVEEVFDPATAMAPFIVGEVMSAEKHPDADKLQVCQVKTGKGIVQVVCGAPNARTGLKGVFAPSGTYVPGIDLLLKPAKIRGQDSHGMLLSERELEISEEHDGIIELPESCKAGDPAAPALGLDDPVIEIAITPNRPDCLGVRGIARDLAAAGVGTLKDDTVKPVEGAFDNPVAIDLKFDKDMAAACPAFAGQLVKGVKNGPSPDWLQRRLKAIGLRPINALADITNYISYDRGRPLHVYDADKVKGTIHARLGNMGEEFEALDGNTYKVDEKMTVIADDNGVLGLGGIIGGEASGCSEGTVNVLIESAYFDPIRTASTGRKLNILSDARFRFERGVDPAFIVPGLEMATQMVVELCGGEASKVTLAGTPPEDAVIFDFDTAEVQRLTGLEMAQVEIKSILTSLGFWLSGRGPDYKVSVPTWRPDVSQPADLVEEVIRIVGVDSVDPVPLARGEGIARSVLTTGQKRVRLARRTLAGRGLVEAVTWSFISSDHAKAFGGGQDELELANPISADLSSMRPSLLPGLIAATQRNHARGFSDVALFEVGQAYRGADAEDQFIAAAGVRSGTAKLSGSGRHWSRAGEVVDLFDAKADALNVLDALGYATNAQTSRSAPDWYHPGKSGVLQLGPKNILAHFGELHPLILEQLDVDGPLCAFEVFLNALPEPKRATRTRPALDVTDLQMVRRDFAFLVDEAVAAGDVLRAAKGSEKALISDVILFDVFTGTGVPEGKKSLAIEVTLSPRDKTLTDEEIDGASAKVVAAVTKATGGELRG